MHDSFVPVNVREGHPHVRGLINFLISLFRATALLTVLEYLVCGNVEKSRQRVFWEFYDADLFVADHDPDVWSYRKTEMLGAMGLILAPHLFSNAEDIECITNIFNC